ncbi:hypothetical protein MKY88_08390 [Lysinibacillus sp. FSL R7-0073]|uniref:hypothetical protein n=1 Tax=Lysinibacillus sp. FSL R7-0073 TaxID=2921669 RepID=UPI0030FC0787
MPKNKVNVLKMNNLYKRFIMSTLCLLTLTGCTNQETTNKLNRNEEIHDTKEMKELSAEDQKRQEKAENIEKSIIELIEQENYLDTITHYKNSFIKNVDKKLKPTEKTIELYNIAVEKYIEKAETFNYYDYNLLSLDMENLNENVLSLINKKFPTNIEEIEAFIKNNEEEARESYANMKAENEAKEKARIIEEAKNRVYIGMTKEQVLATNWGKPNDINRTITTDHISEQWVYSAYDKYLYFEDGILVAIQD